eukprot:scaffold428_cov168-Ochromonas_danica.AAC.22
MATNNELTSNDLISSLWSGSSIDKCRIGLCDAILYEAGLPVRWYVTGGAGEVKLKRNVDLSAISRRWLAIAEQSESSFVAAIRQEGLVKFLSRTAWEAFVEEGKVADPALLSVHCFLGRGTNPIIYRNSYSMNLTTGRWKTNTLSYTVVKDEIMSIIYEEKLKFVDNRAAQIAKVLDLASTTVIRYVEKMLRIQIVECSLDFVIDRKSQIWMLWANKTFFKKSAATGESISRPLSSTNRLSESIDPFSETYDEDMIHRKDENTGHLLSQQLEEMANHDILKRNPNAEKIHSANTLNNFIVNEKIEKNKNNSNKRTTSFPTPFKCIGDYCHLLVQPVGALTVDKKTAAMHLASKLFTEKEIETLKKDPNYSKMMDFSSSALGESSADGLLEINKRSVELARTERRGLEQSAFSDISFSSIPGQAIGSAASAGGGENGGGSKKHRYMDSIQSTPNAPIRMEGFPSNMNTYYEPVRVCPTCYDAYRCLDWARGILKRAELSSRNNSLSPNRVITRTNTDKSFLSASPNKQSPIKPATTGGLQEESKQSLESISFKSTQSTEEGKRQSRRGGREKLGRSWKSQITDENVVGEGTSSHRRRNDLAMLDNYIRGKPSSPSYISRENSSQSPQKGKSSSSKPRRQRNSSEERAATTTTATAANESIITRSKLPQSNVYKGKVLLASADSEQVKRVIAILQENFFEVRHVIDGREALNIISLEWKKIDCALIDRDQLPLLDVFEVCKGIRLHEKTLRKTYSLQSQKDPIYTDRFLNFRLPVICFTSATTAGDLSSYMAGDLDGCVSKPVDPTSLLTTIRAAIPQHLAPLPPPTSDESMALKNTSKVQKVGLLGELENSQDSASMALKTLSIMGSNEGSEFQGFVQLDADTKLPYLVLNGSKYTRVRQSSTKEKFFNLVVCHDVFDTYERMKILLQPIIQRYQAIQVLVWNYPGQAQTEWRSTQSLNNEYLAACLNEVLGQVGHLGTRDFNTEEPFYLLGYGYGANIAAYYMAHYRAPYIRGLLLANGWAFVDSYLADYLAKVSVPLALNIYTAVYNSISINGRIALCNGILKSHDIRPLLRSVDCPIVCLHSDQNSFIRPIHVEPFVSNRGGEVRSIYRALQDFRRTCVVWLHGGHEMFQENRKQVVLLLEQILTGYHEVHELTFPSASSIISATNALNANDLKTSVNEVSMEDKFTQSVLNLSKKTANEVHQKTTNPLKPATSPSPIRTKSAHVNSLQNNSPNSLTWGPKASSQKDLLATTSATSSPGKGMSVAFANDEGVPSWQSFSETLLQKQHSILTFDAQKAKDKEGLKKTSNITNINNVPMNDVHAYPEVKEYMQWRLKRNKKRLERLQLAAQSIQCAFRAFLARKLVKTIRELRAASLIQRVFRGHIGRKKFFQHVRMLWAAIYIQKIYRGFIARRDYFILQVRIAAAANIQRLFRGWRGRERVKRIRAERNHAACIIQAMFRRFQARRDAWLRRQFRNCATVIQKNFRGFLGRKRAAAERDKYIFSKSQSQGIEFGRQMLLEHKLHVTKLQSDVTLLSQEKVSAEEQIEALLEEIASFEEGVRVLEKEMHQLSKVESEAAAFMDEDSKFELREQKMRLDREFGEMLGKIANRKDMLNDIEKKLAAIDKARQGKEEDLRTLERKLVVLLEDQQKELNMIKRKQDVRGALLAASHAELNRVTTAASNGTMASNAGLPSSAGGSSGGGGGGGGGYNGGPSLQEKKQAAQLMQSTETLMKFGFMSMSMTYFSSLNMIKALRTVSAQDTVMAALADVHAQRAVGQNGPSSSSAMSADTMSNLTGNAADRVMSRLKKGELPGQQKLQVSSWSVEDVAKWLQSLSLGQYSEAFIDSAIDGEFLYDLNDDDLKNTLGIEHRLHRKKILNCIQRLKMAELQNESRLGKLQHALFAGQGGAAGVGNNAMGPSGPGAMPDLPASAQMPDFANVGFPDGSSNRPEEDSRIIEGPRVSIQELFSYVRHSKLSMLKEAIDYLPNKPFDKSLVQAAFVADFGTVYVSGYERLIFHINKVDEYGNTLLIYACQNGNAKIAKYLANKGANLNHQNKQGQTAAHYAIAYQFFDLSTWLFENGADDTIENKFGLTAYDGLNATEDEGGYGGEDTLAIEN